MGAAVGAEIGVTAQAVAPLEQTSGSDEALLNLLRRLSAWDYAFIAPTPATLALVASRQPLARPGNLRDVFGWGRAFDPDNLDADLLDDLFAADAVTSEGRHLRSRVRVSTLDGRLHLHSARSNDPNAVFLGPDSYRFVRFLRQVLAGTPPVRRAIDIGVGAGAGALALAAGADAGEVVAADVNPAALRFLMINARHAGLNVVPVHGAGLSATRGLFDLIIANPPFIAGDGGRVYRDGGGMHGAELALQWMADSVRRLSPDGRIFLYTGAPVVEGRDIVHDALTDLARDAGLSLDYEEIDPDIFGGSLRATAYADVERIAAVGAVMRR
jgi:methylase of polypeptide subunit release factors